MGETQTEHLDEITINKLVQTLMIENPVERRRFEQHQDFDEIFPPEHWTARFSQTIYENEKSYSNLYENELSRDFRNWLISNGISVREYTAIVGPVQFNSLTFASRSVFPETTGNTGWKICFLGFPALRLIVAGLCHHHRDNTSQRKLSRTSERLRQAAIQTLSEDATKIAEEYDYAQSDHYDEGALLGNKFASIGRLDIRPFGAEKLGLRCVRNTTAKKIIATFFFIQGSHDSEYLATDSENGNQGSRVIQDLKVIASELAKGQ